MEKTELTPKQIVAELNKYIVGQGEAKKSVSIALRNRWRRKRLSEDMQDEIIPKNILLIGPTGVGKTEIARRLAKLVGAPFIKVEATKYTEVGYVGRDVEQMIRDLVANAIRMVQEQESQRYEEKAEEEANKRILQVFWPKKSIKEKVKNPMDVFFSSDDDDDEMPEEPKQLEEPKSDRRQKMFEDICAHKMDDREIEVEVAEQNQGFQGILTGNSTEELTNNFQEMLGSIMPKKKKKRRHRRQGPHKEANTKNAWIWTSSSTKPSKRRKNRASSSSTNSIRSPKRAVPTGPTSPAKAYSATFCFICRRIRSLTTRKYGLDKTDSYLSLSPVPMYLPSDSSGTSRAASRSASNSSP